jgi:cobaltochelatase CobT
MADETPLDRFKSALTGASRAISGDAEADVVWTSDAPVITGHTLRVPMPSRSVPADQAAQVRGFADSMALRLRHHNEALHARNAPVEPSARACYDAVETVRYEAIGARDYAGMRGNLDAAVNVRMGGDPITRALNAKEVPVQAALALLLRERLTGQEAPAPARGGVEMVRTWIEGKAARDFDSLASVLEDQQAFQKLALTMLQHLELTQAEQTEQDATDPDDDDGDQVSEEEEDGGEGSDDQQQTEMASEPSQGEDEDGEPQGEREGDDDQPATRARTACCRCAPTGRGPTFRPNSTTRPIPKSSTR